MSENEKSQREEYVDSHVLKGCVLVCTLDPPTMAAKGRLGTSTAPWR